MALQGTRLQGLASRDENRAAAAESSLFNSTSPGVRENLAPGTELQASIAQPQKQKFATLAESQVLSQQGTIERSREAAIRQQAQLALQERGQQFNQNLALRNADIKEEKRLMDIRKADQNYAQGQLGLQEKQVGLEGKQIELGKNKALLELYGPTMTKPKEYVPVSKEGAGYYISTAKSELGIPDSEIRDADGNLTSQGSDYLDALDVISKRNPDMKEQDRIKEAARISGLRSYDEALADVNDEISSIGTPEDDAGKTRLAGLLEEQRKLQKQMEKQNPTKETTKLDAFGDPFPVQSNGSINQGTISNFVNKAAVSLSSKNPEDQRMAFDVINKLNLRNSLTPDHKAALYDKILIAKSGGDASVLETKQNEMLSNAYDAKNQKTVFDSIKKQYTDFVAPTGKTSSASSGPVRSSLLVPMSQSERGSYTPPSKKEVINSIAKQIGVAPEAAEQLYQNILLHNLKAEDFDNVFEQGDSSSARQASVQNLLNSYLNGNK